jgi:hypothetical protein
MGISGSNDQADTVLTTDLKVRAGGQKVVIGTPALHIGQTAAG